MIEPERPRLVFDCSFSIAHSYRISLAICSSAQRSQRPAYVCYHSRRSSKSRRFNQSIHCLHCFHKGKAARPSIRCNTKRLSRQTNSPHYRKPQFSVLRRYSDFLWLFETLSLNKPGVFIPPVPEKQGFGRFQGAFVEARRLALNNCIQKIANHPLLATDEDFKFFIESDSFALDVGTQCLARAPLISPCSRSSIARRRLHRKRRAASCHLSLAPSFTRPTRYASLTPIITPAEMNAVVRC